MKLAWRIAEVLKILENKLESMKILENELESLKLQENQPVDGVLIICGDMIQRKLGSFVSFREMITSQLQGKLWLYDEVRTRLCLFCHHQIGEDCWDS
ncbi:hypothetical protein Tco_0778323 [Tanacetum coccineum]